MIGQPFQVQHLTSPLPQSLQNQRFPRTRESIEHLPAKTPRGLQDFDHVPAIGLVAAFENQGTPTHLAQYRRQAAGPLTASPAVDQRTIMLFPTDEMLGHVPSNVRSHQAGAQTSRIEGPSLAMQRADAHALIIIENRQVQGPEHVVDGMLTRRSHVDDRHHRTLRRHGCRTRPGWWRLLPWCFEVEDDTIRTDRIG